MTLSEETIAYLHRSVQGGHLIASTDVRPLLAVVTALFQRAKERRPNETKAEAAVWREVLKILRSDPRPCCAACAGRGTVDGMLMIDGSTTSYSITTACPVCGGTGLSGAATPG